MYMENGVTKKEPEPTRLLELNMSHSQPKKEGLRMRGGAAIPAMVLCLNTGTGRNGRCARDASKKQRARQIEPQLEGIDPRDVRC